MNSFIPIISALEGALLALLCMWAVVLLGGRRLNLRPGEERHHVVPLRWWMGALAISLAIGYLLGIVGWTELFPNTEKAHCIGFSIDMLAVPVSVCLFVKLSHAYRIGPATITANFTPFVGMILASVWYGSELTYRVILIISGLYVIANVVLVVFSARRYEEHLQDVYASTYGRSLKWLWGLMVLLVVQFSAWEWYTFSQTLSVRLAYYLLSVFTWNYLLFNLYQMLIIAEHTPEEAHTEAEDDEELIITFDKHPIPLSRSEQEVTACKTDPKREDFLRLLSEVCEQDELYTTEDLTRDMLARKMNMGHTVFTRMLRETTGKNFYEYINSLRISKACTLLAESTLRVDDVGFEVGYRYRSTFYRAFAAQYHCTPAEWRERCKL